MSRDQECQEKKKKELKDVEKAKLEEPEEDELAQMEAELAEVESELQDVDEQEEDISSLGARDPEGLLDADIQRLEREIWKELPSADFDAK